jgi:hypothetical protein
MEKTQRRTKFFKYVSVSKPGLPTRRLAEGDFIADNIAALKSSVVWGKEPLDQAHSAVQQQDFGPRFWAGDFSRVGFRRRVRQVCIYVSIQVTGIESVSR